MSLVGYKPPVGKVEYKDGSFQVKGLSLNDVSVLVQANLNDMENLFQLFDKSIGDGSKMDFAGLTNTLITHAPDFVCAAIALACTEDADFEVRLNAAKTLPMPLQIDAIKIIGSLTFEEAGGVKKFLESLTFLKGALRTPQISQAPSQTEQVAA